MKATTGEHVLEVVRHQAITRELVHALTAGMIEIAEQYGVTYDGWGCHLETGSEQ
jgi:regulator of RNase E activity RraB